MAYATPTDVANALERTFTEHQTERAEMLLAIAKTLIDRRVTVDTENETIAKYVSIEMVSDALGLGRPRGAVSYSFSLADAAESATLSNPSTTLVLTNELLALFDVPSANLPSWHFGD